MKQADLIHERVSDEQERADTYAQKHQTMAARFGREYASKLAARGFEVGKIIDVGCGFGRTAIYLAKEFPGSEIVGIDLSESLLRLANEAAQAGNVSDRVRFEIADVQQIPFEDGSFDLVLNLNMVHIVEHPIQMLDEIERILVPDGLLFVADLRRSWLGLVEKEIRSALTLKEARELFSQSKLREGAFSSDLLWWRFEV